MSRFYVQNFGCRATQADGAAIERQFLDQGLRPVPDSAEADIVVINTCTVTAQADRDARAAIRRFHRQNPERQIIVTGCYAQRAHRKSLRCRELAVSSATRINMSWQSSFARQVLSRCRNSLRSGFLFQIFLPIPNCWQRPSSILQINGRGQISKSRTDAITAAHSALFPACAAIAGRYHWQK